MDVISKKQTLKELKLYSLIKIEYDNICNFYGLENLRLSDVIIPEKSVLFQ
jgi:hypothetical protein